MTCYHVYLEFANGLCMAHVPELPGCCLLADTRKDALRRLPAAILDYRAWLGRHGEPVWPEETPEIEVVGEITDSGPFEPGGKAALLPTDLRPVSVEQREELFRRMGYARADLLHWVRDLPDQILDWQPVPERWELRRVLRHIGNAEKWYTARLVPETSLPAEWAHDEQMPLLDYLEMTRSTALLTLRQLDSEQSAQVLHPTLWTRHPDEGWTLRKALRRFLEHEREHTGQVREALADWRSYLLVETRAARAGLLATLVGVDEATLSELPVFEDWTAKDVLAHIAAWDETHLERMQTVRAGRERDLQAMDTDAQNAIVHAARRGWPLEHTLTALTNARAAYLEILGQVPDDDLHRLVDTPWGPRPLRFWAERRAQHDLMHTSDLLTWREAQGLGGGTGPKVLFLAQLTAAREELLAAAALVCLRERMTRHVCGEWTLKDVLGHVADWERMCVEALTVMCAGGTPDIHVPDMEAWNQAHHQARRDESWDSIWADLHQVRAELLCILQAVDESALARPSPNPWDPAGTPYRWVTIFMHHDRHHARDIRAVLGAEVNVAGN